MKLGKWARFASLLVAVLATGLLAGCGDFWQAPSSITTTSFTLSSSGSITVSPGAAAGNTTTISVTPSNSFTGTVALSCAVTSSPTSATSPPSCSFSPASVSISGTTAATSTLTAATSSTTTTGTYQLTVTGSSNGVSESTAVCVEVTSSSSGSCTSSSSTSGVFYVLNQTTDQAVAFSIASGQLNTIGAVTLPSSPLAIAVAPNGQFLYVSTESGIYLYTIQTGGALTPANSGAVIAPDAATTMQVDSTNSWLVETESGAGELNAIAINSSTGGLAAAGETEQAFNLPASTATQLALSPNDSSSCTDCYVFVAMGSAGTELVRFNPAAANPFGAFGTQKLVNSGGGDNTVSVDPTNRFLYVGETDALPSQTQTGGLRVFSIAANGITEIGGSPYAAGGTGPSAILPTADGNYVFVANQSVSGSSNGNIAGFSVSSTGLTTSGTIAAGPSGHLGLAEDSTGSFVLAVDVAGNPDLQAYMLSSGTLSSTLNAATGTDPAGAIAIAAAP